MDRQYIQQHNIVERYLSGDLLVREARLFEKYCREHPELLHELPIPVRLKARLAHEPMNSSETGTFPAIPPDTTIGATSETANDEDPQPRPPDSGSKTLIYSLAIAALGLTVALVLAGLRNGELDAQLQELQQSARRTQLRAPSDVQSFKVALNRSGIPASPSVELAWPDPARLLELYFETHGLNYTQYQVTVEKQNEARLFVIRRMTRDSNRALRLALNSSAFGPGEYVLKFEGYTWRGKLEPAGWAKLRMQ